MLLIAVWLTSSPPGRLVGHGRLVRRRHPATDAGGSDDSGTDDGSETDDTGTDDGSEDDGGYGY